MLQMTRYLKLNRSILYDELDTARDLKNECTFEDSFGVMITCATREKIFNMAIQIFGYIRYNKYDAIMVMMPTFTRRIKLHTYQLKKLQQDNYDESVTYFKDLVRIIYSWCIKYRSHACI